jgi:hypothetical protein
MDPIEVREEEGKRKYLGRRNGESVEIAAVEMIEEARTLRNVSGVCNQPRKDLARPCIPHTYVEQR